MTLTLNTGGAVCQQDRWRSGDRVLWWSPAGFHTGPLFGSFRLPQSETSGWWKQSHHSSEARAGQTRRLRSSRRASHGRRRQGIRQAAAESHPRRRDVPLPVNANYLILFQCYDFGFSFLKVARWLLMSSILINSGASLIFLIFPIDFLKSLLMLNEIDLRFELILVIS